MLHDLELFFGGKNFLNNVFQSYYNLFELEKYRSMIEAGRLKNIVIFTWTILSFGLPRKININIEYKSVLKKALKNLLLCKRNKRYFKTMVSKELKWFKFLK